MAKFLIKAKSVDSMYVVVNARDEDHARDIYDELDGSEFHNDDSYWELSDITPVDDDYVADFDFMDEEDEG